MNQSKKISRKVISVLLSLLMVLSCFSGMGLTAFASEPYLTFTGTDSFSIKTNNSEDNWDGTLQYSTDANTWTTWDGMQISSDNNVLYLRGTGNTKITGSGSSSNRWVITTQGNVACSGDIRTLLDYSEPESSEMGTYCFSYLFYNCTSLTAAPELPATILANNCYYNMFYGCTSLTTAPELPATMLAYQCYSNMFYGCESLTTAPELWATTLTPSCYNGMFNGCTSLTTAPELPATTLADLCYFNMFNGCESLTTAPALPATTLAKYCYFNMFNGCTGIKLSTEKTAEYSVPYSIPKEGTGTEGKYSLMNMFSGTGGTFTGTPTINTTYYIPAPHTHDDITFTAWESTNSLPTEAGNYYLTNNVVLAESWNVPEGTTNLCLNGKSVTTTEETYLFVVGAGSGSDTTDALNLFDDTGEGFISKKSSTNYSDCVFINKNSNFTMNSGKITNSNGTGVYVNKGGKFTMNGGEISHNSAYIGGVYVAKDAEFTMNGGEITGNQGVEFGGVYVEGGYADPEGEEYCKAPGKFNVSGKVNISGNTVGTNECNVFLGQADGYNPGPEYNSVITLTGALDEDSVIGVTMIDSGVFTAGFDGKGAITNFTSDDSTYKIKTQGKELKLSNHEHSFTYSASGATITATCSADGCPLENSKATLTIAAPDNLTYDKSAKAAVITDANAIQGTAKVQYQTKNGSTYGEATETAPTNAGTYKASITVGGATASVEYTIAKADPTYTAPTGVTATYGDTLADIALPTGWTWADNTASVGNAGTNTFKASFVPTDTTNYNTKTNIDVSVTVAKKEVTVSGIKANNKVYDGSCNATIDTSRATISGALSGDTLTVSADASFSDKNVGEDKTVYLSNITLGGESASNYTLASSGQQETTEASITAKEVTISGITANNKVYDGTTAATVNYTSATIQGMVSGDDLSIYTDFASGNFADKNVGNNKTVTISSLLLTGYDAANYTVGSVTVTANITAKEVGLEWSNTELTYNGKAQKPTATATGLAGQDTCTVTVVGEQTNAGNNYTATAQSLSNSNYKLPENKTTAFKINKASQTAPAAPTEASKTINSITLNEIPNGEYKCGAGDWQTSPTFTGLDQNKSYVFRQRYAADANHNASAGSEEAVIYTANHTHSFTYSSSNGTITATCNGAGTCDLTDNKVSFTLTAPTNLVYDGTDKKATLEGVDAFNAATGLNVSANDIVYNDLTNVVTETKNAGTYQALYTLQTDFPRPFAGITFTIAKADPTYEAPKGIYAAYGDTLADVALPEGWAWVDGTTNVGDVGKKAFKANFTPADTTNYNVVENVDVTVKVNQAEITPTVTLDGWTYGETANKPSVTGNAGNGDVTYLYKEKGASDMSCTDVVPTEAGEYTVKALVYETQNYTGGEAEADFTIAKAKVTVTADDKTIMREAALKELTYKVDGKILDGDDLGIKVTSNVKPAVAGKYDIKVAYTENANYDVTVVNGTYTVTDRITATEKTAGKNKINSSAKASASKKGVTVKWGKVANAEKYEIYATYCGKKNKYKKIKTVKGNINSFDITKLGGKKLNTSKCLKVYVVAYRKVNGKYEKITQSVNMHIAGTTNKHTNAKAIKVKKSSYTLKVNKTATIKPTLVLQKKNKKAVEHVAKFRYQSTNKAVATVDKNGKIKAVGKGTCTIYIFANNGKLNSVKVTVK